MHRITPVLCFLLAIYAGACASSSTTALAQDGTRTDKQLKQVLSSILDDEQFRNAWWGVHVVDVESGREVYHHMADQSFIPASNTKLFTTAAVLDQLGPDFMYETTLYRDGPIVDGVLKGNIIVRGSGDPVIGGRFNDGDLTEAFRKWASTLKEQGIRTIDGDVIGDDDFFDDTLLGYGWSWDDEPYWYAAEIGALSFNDNCVDFSLVAQQPGQPTLVEWAPHQTSFIQVSNQSVTLGEGSDLEEGYARTRDSNQFTLSSHVPSGRTDYESLSVHNPTAYFVHVFREVLLKEGIAVTGRPVDGDMLSIKPDYANTNVVAITTHESVPMADIVGVINKRSQNLYAEQVLKSLGALRPMENMDYLPGSAAMGVAASMHTFAAARVDTSRLQLVDGSGLSRMNLIAPSMTTALLQYMWHHDDEATKEAWLTSLPIGGIDGTLRFRYKEGEPGRNNVRAKTGTVSNASTLSGYVTSVGGTTFAFSIMNNHYTIPTSESRSFQDALVNVLANHQR